MRETASLELNKESRLFDEPTLKKTFSSYCPDVSAVVSTNQNLMDFYKSYPMTSNWVIMQRHL